MLRRQNDTGAIGARIFPSPTAGNGLVRKNSRRDGSGQGRGSPKRRAPCKQCGFLNDLRSINIGGGNISGDGGLSGVTKSTETGTTLAGATITHDIGTQVVNKGSGCAFCGSQNSASENPYKGRNAQRGRNPNRVLD